MQHAEYCQGFVYPLSFVYVVSVFPTFSERNLNIKCTDQLLKIFLVYSFFPPFPLHGAPVRSSREDGRNLVIKNSEGSNPGV